MTDRTHLTPVDGQEAPEEDWQKFPQRRRKAADINTDASLREMVAEAADFWDVSDLDDFENDKAAHMLDQQVRKILQAQKRPWHEGLWSSKSNKANDAVVYEWIERAIKEAALGHSMAELLDRAARV